MSKKPFPFQDLPREGALRELSADYPGLAPVAFETYLYLRRFNDELFKALEAHFGRHGLSVARAQVLILLYKSCIWEKSENGIAPSELAARLGVTRGAMTGMLESMEQDGWIVKSEHPEDRRSLLVKIGRKGITKVEALLPDHFGRISKAMSGLSESEHRKLQQMLRDLAGELSEIAEP